MRLGDAAIFKDLNMRKRIMEDVAVQTLTEDELHSKSMDDRDDDVDDYRKGTVMGAMQN